MIRSENHEIIVDNFAGGGGASEGIETALGRPVDYAINHDPEAVAMHRANHPQTRHFCESVWDVRPRDVVRGRPMGLGWFSPDCTFHSKARGGKPFRDRDPARRRRGLAWLVVPWIRAAWPRVIMLENVEEFADWGPLLPDGKPCPIRRGMTFRRWHRQIENLGYQIDMRELRACDYSAPTTRKRLFIIARRDDREIVFPDASHGPSLRAYRTAADCIDWSIPCPSIFGRKRPLAEATLRRIARGVMRYVVNNRRPFIVPITHHGDSRVHSIDEPMRTITTASRGEMALCTPHLVSVAHGDSGGRREYSLEEPLGTVSSGGVQHALIAPTLINTRNGERLGQAPRVRDIEEPYPTVTAIGSQGALVAAFLARHYGGHENDGADLRQPMHTVTAKDHHAIVTAAFVAQHNTERTGYKAGRAIDVPLSTVVSSGGQQQLVQAFLMAYYTRGGDGDGLDSPIRTLPTKDRMALVTVHGEPYQIVDIGMRMLAPRELFRAQSFRDDYIIDHGLDERGERVPLTKTAQVRMCGNSVPPVVAEALVRANLVDQRQEAAVA